MSTKLLATEQEKRSPGVDQPDKHLDTAQGLWAARPLRERLRVLSSARHELALMADTLVDLMPCSLSRTRADSLTAEIIPLLAACHFLEREAASILGIRKLGEKGRPFWLKGLDSRIERVPLGIVLVIGPSNYPLFLPGVQVLQALAAGNAVIWKPGTGGQGVARVFASAMQRAGLPAGLLFVTGERVTDGIAAVNSKVDKIFFTGSGSSGRAVLRAAAETATPVVAELSGCDAVIVLPSANVERVVAAIAFGMRLNGSATCMAPRRLMLIGGGHDELLNHLRESFAEIEGVEIRDDLREQLRDLVEDAAAAGASVCGDVRAALLRPLLLLHGQPELRICQADIFAPVITVMEFADVNAMLEADQFSPFGLTAAVFGDEEEARRIGAKLKVGTVLVNDLIVPTADPRVPFGGRRGSGFGVTRGAEGLLEMTAVKTTLARRGNDLRHYVATTEGHEDLFLGVLQLSQAFSLKTRLGGLRRTVRAAMKLSRRQA